MYRIAEKEGKYWVEVQKEIPRLFRKPKFVWVRANVNGTDYRGGGYPISMMIPLSPYFSSIEEARDQIRKWLSGPTKTVYYYE